MLGKILFALATGLLSITPALADDGNSGERMQGSGGIGFFDGDGDGAVSQAEFVEARLRRFQAMDGNGDGVLSEEESGRRPANAQRPQRSGHMFARLDENKDGQVSLPEFQAGGTLMFARLDADQDGAVTTEELERLRGRRGKRAAD